MESRRVWVEADIRAGLPAFTIVGLADMAVREARERVRSAITNSGFEFPQKRITINLAPAYLRKIGPGFDLPLAMSVLAASGQVEAEAVADCAMAGELSLTGELRPVRGALAVAQGAAVHGIGRVIVPASRAREAALIEQVAVIGVTALYEAVDVLAGRREVPPLPEPQPASEAASAVDLPDLCDVRGHDALLPAIVVAAAGGHNLFLHGPPGTGKTMLARRIPSILPPLTQAEAIEVTRIHSISGLHSGGGLVEARPFRAPHHTISPSGLVGGGAVPTPGEVTLAHASVCRCPYYCLVGSPSALMSRATRSITPLSATRGGRPCAAAVRSASSQAASWRSPPGSASTRAVSRRLTTRRPGNRRSRRSVCRPSGPTGAGTTGSAGGRPAGTGPRSGRRGRCRTRAARES